MKMQHRVVIRSQQPDGSMQNVLHGSEITVREKILRWLFGEKKRVLIISPEDTVYRIEIHERDLGKMFDKYLSEAFEEKEATGEQSDESKQ